MEGEVRDMFEKMVAIEPVNLTPEARTQLRNYAKEVIFYEDIPTCDAEIQLRLGDADAMLVSYTTYVGRNVLETSHLRYIGMCCSLYEEKSANVDIAAAREKSITVRGIRDYGDEGVAEYVVSELVRYLHGFGPKQWKDTPLELTGLNVGVIGMGATGGIIAEALHFFGSDISYFSRSRKKQLESEKGYRWLPLEELLPACDVLVSCLPKNTVLLDDEQFARMGDGKILFNTSVAPSYRIPALEKWLACGENEFFCDMFSALGETPEQLLKNEHVHCVGKAAGTTRQAKDRLSKKVIENIQSFLEKKKT